MERQDTRSSSVQEFLVSNQSVLEKFEGVSDNQVVHQAKAGDQEAYSCLFVRYYGRVGSYLAGIMGVAYGDQICDDICEDTWSHAFKALDTYDEQVGKFSAWILTSARNRLMDYFRYKKRHPAFSFDYLDESTPTSSGFEDDISISLDFQEALPKLTPSCSAVIRLGFVYDLSLPEIAQTLGISLGAVKSRKSRGRAQLQSLVA